MTNILVDLKSTIIPDSHRIWKLFPGESYKFDKLFDETKILFLDVRGIADLDFASEEEKVPDLLDRVSKDRWERQNLDQTNRTERRVSPGDRQTATLVEGLLRKAKRGDLVAVPSRGPDGVVNVFELLENPGQVKKLDAQDGRRVHTYVGRRATWLGSIKKRQLDYSVIELLHTPVAFFDLGNAGREDIYEEVFGNYIYKDSYVATYRVSKSDYNARDNRVVSTWMELVDVLTSLYSIKNTPAASNNESIYDLLDRVSLGEEDRSDLVININSPGEILMKALNAAPLIGLALFPLALANMPYEEVVKAEVHVTSIGSPVDTCKAELDSSVRSVVEAMGATQWEQACKLATRARDDAKVATNSTIEKIK